MQQADPGRDAREDVAQGHAASGKASAPMSMGSSPGLPTSRAETSPNTLPWKAARRDFTEGVPRAPGRAALVEEVAE